MSTHQSPHAQGARPPGYIPGYSGVLIRQDVKTDLGGLRRRLGFEAHRNGERCLTSAFVKYCMEHLSDQEIVDLFEQAMLQDTRLIFAANSGNASPNPRG